MTLGIYGSPQDRVGKMMREEVDLGQSWRCYPAIW